MRALVTGAGHRVGRAIAVELAKAGFEVAIHYRTSRAGAEATLAAVRAAGSNGLLVHGDLARVSEVHGVVDAVRGAWETLDLLVNNASMFKPVAFEEITLDHWETMMGVHVRAPFLLTQGLLPLLRAGGATEGRAPGEGGVVVNIADIGAERPLPGFAAYSVSKAALVMLTKALAVELAPAVRCVGISPGQVAWPPDYDEDKRERIARRIPMGRVGSPGDVARLVRFVAVEGAYLNGVILPVDGGLQARY
ncbi:MAG: SDR family oxidoreductase [Alphaproteobacteria bacterium]|nr:SDR family oxidoreductase [Alphaproteobacteria bacterium]